MARTGMYVLQGIVPSEVALAPFDVKVIDLYNDDGVAFTPTQVAQMGGGAQVEIAVLANHPTIDSHDILLI
ncbi:hypothetical protein [Novosphingobium sp. KCTC 2891]|uniref:hypothetical protein n=1 Tax=Novosphingobium sp. KCTC 2891 TaxID=2989730 RepID=UPI0022212C87|nr:hypothetical protein [Novosphingobium sp. KCTC 2891]